MNADLLRRSSAELAGDTSTPVVASTLPMQGQQNSIDLGELKYDTATAFWEECMTFRSALPFYLEQLEHDVKQSQPVYANWIRSQKPAPWPDPQVRAEERRAELEQLRRAIAAEHAKGDSIQVSQNAGPGLNQNHHQNFKVSVENNTM